MAREVKAYAGSSLSTGLRGVQGPRWRLDGGSGSTRQRPPRHRVKTPKLTQSSFNKGTNGNHVGSPLRRGPLLRLQLMVSRIGRRFQSDEHSEVVVMDPAGRPQIVSLRSGLAWKPNIDQCIITKHATGLSKAAKVAGLILGGISVVALLVGWIAFLLWLAAEIVITVVHWL